MRPSWYLSSLKISKDLPDVPLIDDRRCSVSASRQSVVSGLGLLALVGGHTRRDDSLSLHEASVGADKLRER